MAIKKILLYAMPVIESAPLALSTKAPESKEAQRVRGILLTASYNMEAMLVLRGKAIRKRIVAGDKFVLLGFAFPSVLVNNLDITTFPLKYAEVNTPRNGSTNSYKCSIDLSHLKGIAQTKADAEYFLIDPKHYEDVDLYNEILKIIRQTLNDFVGKKEDYLM